jgi:hypothetical protein
MSTKIIEKDLPFRPECIRVKFINDLKKETNDRLCSIEVKICDISDDIAVVFEESNCKRVQKLKKNITVGDSSGALSMTLWESQFNQIAVENSYHVRLVKIRIYNDQISLTAKTDTSYVIPILYKKKNIIKLFSLFLRFIKIDELQNVMTEIDNSINRTHTLYGQIKSLENNNNNYTCQGCGKGEKADPGSRDPMDPAGSHGSHWIPRIPLDPTGSRWIPLDPTGSHWILLDPTGSHWIPLDPTGSHWILLDPNECF